MKKNLSGFSLIESLLLLILVGLVGFTGWYVFRSKTATNSIYNGSASISSAIKVVPKPTGTLKELTTTDIDRLKATAPTTTSSSSTTTTTQPAPTSSPSTTNNQTSASASTPSPPLGTISLSSDGCYVTATGLEGMSVEIGAFKPNKGGSATYTLLASGTLTKATGGFKDMTAYGQLTAPNGVYIYNSTTITADSCPPAG